MEVAARLKHVSMAPQKVRLVVDQIRGMAVGKALNLLAFSTKQAAHVVKKLLQSAIANAENNAGADIDELFVSTAFVDAGPTAKRTMPRAKGRADRILKRTSHITIKVSDSQERE